MGIKIDITTVACDYTCVFENDAAALRFRETVLRGDAHLQSRDIAAIAFHCGASVEAHPLPVRNVVRNVALPPQVAADTAIEIEALANDLAELP